MSYTNTTPNLGLPQWLPDDKPNWDIDENEAFEKIDTFAGDSDTKIAQLKGDIGKNSTDIDTINTALVNINDAQKVQDDRIVALEQSEAGTATNLTKLNNDVKDLTDQVDQLDQSVTASTAEVAQLKSQVDLNTQNITGVQGDIGDWGATYPTDTITKKITELSAGGTGGTNIKHVSFRMYGKNSTSNGFTIPNYNGENVLILSGLITNGLTYYLAGTASGGAYATFGSSYNILPFKEAFNAQGTQISIDNTPLRSYFYVATFVNKALSGGEYSGLPLRAQVFNANVSKLQYNGNGEFKFLTNPLEIGSIGSTSSSGLISDQANTWDIEALLIPDGASMQMVNQAISDSGFDPALFEQFKNQMNDYHTLTDGSDLKEQVEDNTTLLHAVNTVVSGLKTQVDNIYTTGMTYRAMKLKDTAIYAVGMASLRANTNSVKLIDTNSTVMLYPLGLDDPTNWLYINKEHVRDEKTVTINGQSLTFVIQRENDTTISMMVNESGGQTINQYPILLGVL